MKKFLITVIAFFIIPFFAFSAYAEEMTVCSDEAVSETTNEATDNAPSPSIAENEKWEAPTTLEGWEQYIKEEIIPIVVLVLSVVAAIYVAISPILIKIKKASEKFKSATKDVNDATGQVRENKKEIEELRKELLEDFSRKEQALTEKIVAQEGELAEKIEAMKKESAQNRTENAANRQTLSDIREMIRLGLGNMDELVQKGTAHSIMKIGKQKEKKNLGERK